MHGEALLGRSLSLWVSDKSAGQGRAGQGRTADDLGPGSGPAVELSSLRSVASSCIIIQTIYEHSDPALFNAGSPLAFFWNRSDTCGVL